MTEIRVIRRGSCVCGLELCGHSGYEEQGKDIVCAALSTLIQTLEIGLTEVLRIEGVSTKVDEKLAYMGVFWGQKGNRRVEDLVNTIIAALKSIENSYPSYTLFVEVKVNENDQSSAVRP
ncbi:MAG: ribosomal-processing cysteine protease Prp [Thermovirgaceae bacterium]|nr:ribosomal-processing cysteine protease Prp [Thermovirgaceae bacterium]